MKVNFFHSHILIWILKFVHTSGWWIFDEFFFFSFSDTAKLAKLPSWRLIDFCLFCWPADMVKTFYKYRYLVPNFQMLYPLINDLALGPDYEFFTQLTFYLWNRICFISMISTEYKFKYALTSLQLKRR